MKKYIFILLSAVFVASCDPDFLTKLPETDLTPENYFKSESELQLWTNRFYNLIEDQDEAATLFADDNIGMSLNSVQKGNRKASSESWSWSYLRYINDYFANREKCENESIRNKYTGVSYFFRALFYYQKVRKYGDVPYYDYVIRSDDEASLFKARDSRAYVMKRVIEDLDDAAEYLPVSWPSNSVYQVTKYAALALKARVALFEGTFRKYHQIPDETLDGVVISAEWFLRHAADAASQVMQSGKYSLYSQSNKNLDPTTPTPYREYFTLTSAETSETILSKRYEILFNITHSVQFNFNSNRESATRRFVNHYLKADGTPIQDVPGWETLSYAEQFEGRDPRMAQTIQAPGYIDEGASAPSYLAMSKTITGYRVIKYICTAAQNQGAKSVTDYPVLRYAEVLLNYAEAKAELGELTFDDVDATINLIRERAGVAKLTAVPIDIDPLMREYYPNASGAQVAAVLEVRRERTVELFAEGHRQWDMLRWKEGNWLTPSSTKGFSGIYVAALGEQDFDADGTPDAYFYKGASAPSGISKAIPVENIVRIGTNLSLSNGDSGYLTYYASENYKWKENRDYLWPIPLSQIQATHGGLTQNNGYEDIDR